MTTAAMEELRRRNNELRASSQRAVDALGCSFNVETLERLDELLAPGGGSPPVRGRGRRRTPTRSSPPDALAWAIAERVRAARQRKDWRQEDLARESGLARANVARLESGRGVPKLPTLERVARALGVRTAVLLTRPASAQGPEDRFLAESGIGGWADELEAQDKAR